MSIGAFIFIAFLKPHYNRSNTSFSFYTTSNESSAHWLPDTVTPPANEVNAKTTILLLGHIHRHVCDDGKSKWQHPANIQRLAESDTDTSLTIPSCSADICTHKYTHNTHKHTPPSQHHTTSLSGCQGAPANTHRLSQQTPFCPGFTFQDLAISL